MRRWIAAIIAFAAPAAIAQNVVKGPVTVGSGLHYSIYQSDSYIWFGGNPPVDADAARTETRSILQSDGLREAFEVEPHGAMVHARHRASGLRCEGARILIEPKAGTDGPFNPGNAAGCIFNHYRQQAEVFVVHAPGGMRPERALPELVEQIKLEQPSMQQIIPDTRIAAPDRVSAQLLLGTGDEPRYLYLTAASSGDWIVFTRTRCPITQRALCNRVGDSDLSTALRSVGSR